MHNITFNMSGLKLKGSCLMGGIFLFLAFLIKLNHDMNIVPTGVDGD